MGVEAFNLTESTPILTFPLQGGRNRALKLNWNTDASSFYKQKNLHAGIHHRDAAADRRGAHLLVAVLGLAAGSGVRRSVQERLAALLGGLARTGCMVGDQADLHRCRHRSRWPGRARHVHGRQAGVVDADDSSIVDAPRTLLLVDRRKAALLGVSQQAIVTTLRAGLAGEATSYLHDGGKYPAPATLQLPPEKQGDLDALLQLAVRSADGKLVPIRELRHAL